MGAGIAWAKSYTLPLGKVRRANLRPEGHQTQPGDGSIVFQIGCGERAARFKSRSRNERINDSKPVRDCIFLQQIYCRPKVQLFFVSDP